MNNSNQSTPTKNNKVQYQYNFQEHETIIQNMKKRIIELQKTLNQSNLPAIDFETDNQKLNQQPNQYNILNEHSKQVSSPLKENLQKQVKFINCCSEEKYIPNHPQKNEIQQSVVLFKKSLPQISDRKQIQKLWNQQNDYMNSIKLLKQQNQYQTHLLIKKQQIIDSLEAIKLQQQQQIKSLKLQIQNLLAKMQKIQLQFNQKGISKNQSQFQIKEDIKNIPITFAESQILDLKQIQDKNLENVSFGQSFVINQKNQPFDKKLNLNTQHVQSDNQLMSIGSLEEDTPPHSAKILKQLRQNNQNYSAENYDINQINASAECSSNFMPNIQQTMENMEKLIGKNKEFQIQNQLLMKVNQSILNKNKILQSKIKSIYQIIQKKQQQKVQKQIEKIDIKSSLDDLEMMLNSIKASSTNYPNEVLSQNLITEHENKNMCLNCRELWKFISKMKTSDSSEFASQNI